MIWTIPNLISLVRIPLAFVFLQSNPLWRVFAIFCALCSDGLDGYLARKYSFVSRLGTLLDPLMDKFFVIFTLGILISEQQIEIWKVTAMLCRDFSIIFFGGYLTLTGQLSRYQLRAIWCGKISTVLQMLVLIALTLQVVIPAFVFISFIILGLFALIELYLADHSPTPHSCSKSQS